MGPVAAASQVQSAPRHDCHLHGSDGGTGCRRTPDRSGLARTRGAEGPESKLSKQETVVFVLHHVGAGDRKVSLQLDTRNTFAQKTQ